MSNPQVEAAMRELFAALMAAVPEHENENEALWHAFGDLEEALFLRGLYTPVLSGKLSEIVGGPEDGALLFQPDEPEGEDDK